MGNLVQKTLIEHNTFDPVKNLWRNVLVTAIEDAIKLKNRTIQFKEFHKDKTYYEIEYVTKPNRDFDGVCYLANLDGNLVRKKINKMMKDMRIIMAKTVCPRCHGNGYIKVMDSIENPTEIIHQCPQCNSCLLYTSPSPRDS